MDSEQDDQDYVELLRSILVNYKVDMFEQTIRSNATMTLTIELKSKAGSAPMVRK